MNTCKCVMHRFFFYVMHIVFFSTDLYSVKQSVATYSESRHAVYKFVLCAFIFFLFSHDFKHLSCFLNDA